MATILEGMQHRKRRLLARSRAHRRRRAPTLLLLATAITLAGCFSSGFTYISHRSPDATLLGFKLPGQWKTFDTQQVLEAVNGPISSSEAKNVAAGEWIESFSAAPKPVANFFGVAETSQYPIGYVEARPLSPGERDGFNFPALRSEILGTDPLAAKSPDPYTVTAYSEFASTTNGLRGAKLTTNIKLASGATATLSQIVEVDSASNWVFSMAVACKASCWGPNAGVINQILKSWAVKETKS